MRTPSHAVLNLALLSQPDLSQISLPIAIGAVLPDAPIFVLYAWAKLVRRQPERQIWAETYELPFWQTWVALFHSIPLALIIFGVAHGLGWSVVELLCLSMVFHSLLDLPVHNSDAHRHFFPFSHYRFISPFSYWDPRCYGAIVSLVETGLVLLATLYVFPQITSGLGQALLVATNLLYVLGAIYFRLVRPRRLAAGSQNEQ